MPYASCPTAVVNAPADMVWALLATPAGWGDVFDIRVTRVNPPGPAVAGQFVSDESGFGLLHLKPTFQTIEIDPDRYRLPIEVSLPFGPTVHEKISSAPIDDKPSVAISIFRWGGGAPRCECC